MKGCDKTETSCPTGTQLVNQCTKEDGQTYGDCVDCLDENAANNPCKGMYTCSGGGREPVGRSTCSCGNVPYYERCLVEETCFDESIQENGGSCFAAAENRLSGWNAEDRTISWNSGYYYVKDKCTKVDGTKVIAYYRCDGSYSKDCSGAATPAYGKKRCDGDKGTGMIECGGYKWFDTCDETCDDEYI